MHQSVTQGLVLLESMTQKAQPENLALTSEEEDCSSDTVSDENHIATMEDSDRRTTTKKPQSLQSNLQAFPYFTFGKIQTVQASSITKPVLIPRATAQQSVLVKASYTPRTTRKIVDEALYGRPEKNPDIQVLIPDRPLSHLPQRAQEVKTQKMTPTESEDDNDDQKSGKSLRMAREDEIHDTVTQCMENIETGPADNVAILQAQQAGARADSWQ